MATAIQHLTAKIQQSARSSLNSTEQNHKTTTQTIPMASSLITALILPLTFALLVFTKGSVCMPAPATSDLPPDALSYARGLRVLRMYIPLVIQQTHTKYCLPRFNPLSSSVAL